MDVRPASPTDHADVERLLRQLHPDAASAQLREVRQGARTCVAVDDDGESVIGCALCTFVDYGTSNYGMIEELVVHEAARRCGAGAKLLEACHAWLAEAGVGVVFVSAVDAEAEAYYARHGFSRCSGTWLYRRVT